MSCVCGGDWQTRVAADEMATVLMNRLLIAGSRAVNCHAATLTCNYRGPSCIFITLLCILINNFELLFTSRRLFKSPLVPLKSKVVFLLGVWRGKNSLAVYASCFFSFFFYFACVFLTSQCMQKHKCIYWHIKIHWIVQPLDIMWPTVIFWGKTKTFSIKMKTNLWISAIFDGEEILVCQSLLFSCVFRLLLP